MEVVDVIIIGLGYVYRLKGKAWYKRNERGGGGWVGRGWVEVINKTKGLIYWGIKEERERVVAVSSISSLF